MSRELFIDLTLDAGLFLVAAVVVWAGRRAILRWLAGLDIVKHQNRDAIHERTRQLVLGLQVLAYGMAMTFAASLALSKLGFAVPIRRPRDVVGWLMGQGVSIAIIVGCAYLLSRAGHLAIDHLLYSTNRDGGLPSAEGHRRARTLGGLASNLVTAAIGTVAALMVLRELSIDILPLLTGAGIAGLAIGFGAQNLVRDTIAGFFMILEDQIRVGDVARVNGVVGTVEDMRLRTIVLRDVEGAVHIFQAGSITTLSNQSKDFAYAVVDVGVARSEKLEKVMDALREVGARLQADPPVGSQILAPIEIMGVESIGTAQVTIRCRFRTQPLGQGDVARALRLRIVEDFQSRGIARVG